MVHDPAEGRAPEFERETGCHPHYDPTRSDPARRETSRGGATDEVATGSPAHDPPSLPALEHDVPVIVLVADANYFPRACRLLRSVRRVDAAWIVFGIGGDFRAQLDAETVAPRRDSYHIEPRRIYVVDPESVAFLSGGKLRVVGSRGSSDAVSVDLLLTSVARAVRQRAIGLVMSRRELDLRGLTALNENGGVGIWWDQAGRSMLQASMRDTLAFRGQLIAVVESGLGGQADAELPVATGGGSDTDPAHGSSESTVTAPRQAIAPTQATGDSRGARGVDSCGENGSGGIFGGAERARLAGANQRLADANQHLRAAADRARRRLEDAEQLARDVDHVLAATQLGVILIDGQMRIRRFSPGVTRAIPLVARDVGRSVADFAPSLGGPELIASIRNVLGDGSRLTYEIEIQQHDYLLHVVPHRDREGVVTGAVLNLVDRGERRDSELHSRRQEARFRQLAEGLDEVFWVYAPESSRMLFASPSFTRMFGFQVGQVYDDAGIWLDAIHDEDRDRVRDAVFRPGIEAYDVTFRVLRSAEGEERHVRAHGKLVRNDTDPAPRLVGFVHDITDAVAQNRRLLDLSRRLEEQAHRDPLTGLWNRRGIESVISGELARARRSGSRMAAVLIDLDDFKKVNDSMGHATGDVVLQDVARRMTTSLRPNDSLARVGGDEFLAILPELRLAEAETVAERVRLAITDSPMTLSGKRVAVSASLGLDLVSPDAVSVEQLLEHLRHALASGKRAGKNRVIVGSQGRLRGVTVDEAEAVLRSLTSGEGLRVFEQGVHDVTTGEVVGVELLARGPAGAYESPLNFFRLAIEHGQLARIDLRCLERCVRESSYCAAPSIHVNVYPSTLIDTPVDRLLALLSGHGGPGRFCLELSEQQFLGNPSYLDEAVRGLRSAGVQIAVDDVGFGRSSLESLIVLEPDVIKVDRAFISGVHADVVRRRSLSRLLNVAERLASSVVAEGVETEADRDLLVELGVGCAQGYFWSRPVPVRPS